MGRFVDLRGQRFGRLVIECRGKTLSRNNGGTILYWLCKCDCGNETEVVGNDLKSGRTFSCGCYQRERSKEYHTTHGMCHTRIHDIWLGMKDRCGNVNSAAYHHYGGRGITVCKEWQKFEPFYEWAMANGYRDDLTIDRIDVNGNYEPSNCRWATWEEQANNTRKNHRLTFNGETHTISEWALILNISYSALASRVQRGWSMDRIFNTPKRRHINGHYIV